MSSISRDRKTAYEQVSREHHGGRELNQALETTAMQRIHSSGWSAPWNKLSFVWPLCLWADSRWSAYFFDVRHERYERLCSWEKVCTWSMITFASWYPQCGSPCIFLCPKHTDVFPSLNNVVAWSWQILDCFYWFYSVLQCHKQRRAFFPQGKVFLGGATTTIITILHTQPSSRTFWLIAKYVNCNLI